MNAHEEFLELCALSTSGELSGQERKRLDRHVVGCRECRQALKQFEAVVDIGVPMLLSELSDRGQTASAHPNSRRDASREWSLGWLSLAATVLLICALGIYGFRISTVRSIDAAKVTASLTNAKLEALKQQLSDGGHQQEVLQGDVVERDRVISILRHEIGAQATALAHIKLAQTRLEDSLQADDKAKQVANEQSARLAQQFEAAAGTLSRTQAELESLRQQQADDQERAGNLNAQIGMLSSQLREADATVAQQNEFLAHDRDIRELMGARDLYIAEIYDVARSGETQKPFGRIFYTRDKSLVFYAYDLKEQPEVKNASTFQAWGQRGQGKALNLGIFYQDSAAKKRWVLKFDNPTELSQIDAVFVTVEPKGGSLEPTGKPLLFASLRIGANHP